MAKRRNPDPRTTARARKKAADILSGEPAKVREEKDPVREELRALAEKEKTLSSELDAVREKMNTLRLRLEPWVGVDRQWKKLCFGRFDDGDFECAELCPLRTECEIESGSQGALVG